jgi:ABC-type sugar transport system ATPase subunit
MKAVPTGTPLVLGIRPEHLRLQAGGNALPLPLAVTQVEQLGGLSLIYGTLPGNTGRLTVQCAGQVSTSVGETLTAYAPAEVCHVFENNDTGMALT